MTEREDSLLDCAERELEEPYTPDEVKTPRTVIAALLLVIAVLALVGTCGRF